MTIVRMKVTCPFCGKEYSFNPSVGKGLCPRCEKRRKSAPQSLTMDESVSEKLLEGGPRDYRIRRLYPNGSREIQSRSKEMLSCC